MNVLVTTQFIENYNIDGPSMYWKFKGGSEYLVKNAPNPATAWAFILLHHGFRNTLGIDTPRHWEEWHGTEEDFTRDFEFGSIVDMAAGEAQPDPHEAAQGTLDLAP